MCGGGVVTTFCQQHFLVVNDMLLGDIDKLSTSIGTSINWRCQESIGDEPASCHCLLLLRCCSWHCCNWHYNLGLDVLNCELLEFIFVDVPVLRETWLCHQQLEDLDVSGAKSTNSSQLLQLLYTSMCILEGYLELASGSKTICLNNTSHKTYHIIYHWDLWWSQTQF